MAPPPLYTLNVLEGVCSVSLRVLEEGEGLKGEITNLTYTDCAWGHVRSSSGKGGGRGMSDHPREREGGAARSVADRSHWECFRYWLVLSVYLREAGLFIHYNRQGPSSPFVNKRTSDKLLFAWWANGKRIKENWLGSLFSFDVSMSRHFREFRKRN
jgi:hypothetical protein